MKFYEETIEIIGWVCRERVKASLGEKEAEKTETDLT